jgi:acyl-CoA thioesterase II
MSQPIDALLSLLDLGQPAQDQFLGSSPQNGWKRVFGGQVIAQALIAASRTVENRVAHSLHAYFILPGNPSLPIVYEVDRIRDGGSFATRRVLAKQDNMAIFMMSASFQTPEDGFSHQMPMPDVPGPDELPDENAMREDVLQTMPEAVRSYYKGTRPIELRPVEFGRYGADASREPRFHVWFRAAGKLPDDPMIHQCVLAYASDMTLLDATLIPHGRTVLEPSIQAASLDHALWLHRPFRADDWLLYAQDSPSAQNSRGFARGQIFDRGGNLVASVAQEGLIRQKRQRPMG